MGTADEQIRVSGRVKKKLDKHRREGESYNDVLTRLLEDNKESNFHDGFGILSDEETDWIRENRTAAKEKRKERTRQLGDDR